MEGCEGAVEVIKSSAQAGESLHRVFCNSRRANRYTSSAATKPGFATPLIGNGFFQTSWESRLESCSKVETRFAEGML
jgi:hypothetical protein